MRYAYSFEIMVGFSHLIKLRSIGYLNGISEIPIILNTSDVDIFNAVKPYRIVCIVFDLNSNVQSFWAS